MFARRGTGIRVTIATSVALAVLAVPAAPASATRPAHATDPASRQLQSALDDVVAAGATGVILRVDDGRRTYRLASGKARLDPAQRMTPGHRLRIGSITKSFVSAVTLQLVGENRLSLDDNVERRQPGLIRGGANITVRQLLNHTSGIFNYTEDEAFVERYFADPSKPATPRELVAVADAHPPVFAPGTSWAYSNTNYVVLGLILQRVTGRPLAQLVEERIIRPLQLRRTTFPGSSPEIPGAHAHGYIPPTLSGDGYVDFTRLSPSVMWAAGALVSTGEDVRRFYRALLGGRLLHPAQLALMKDLVPVEDGYAYGLGLYRTTTPCGRMWGHDGRITGHTTIALNDETGRRGIAVSLLTEPDQRIGEAFVQLVTVAACRALGREAAPSGVSWTPSFTA